MMPENRVQTSGLEAVAGLAELIRDTESVRFRRLAADLLSNPSLREPVGSQLLALVEGNDLERAELALCALTLLGFGKDLSVHHKLMRLADKVFAATAVVTQGREIGTSESRAGQRERFV